MISGLTNALRGVSGEFEVNRVVGAFGATAYVICANVFVGWEIFVKGREFDVTEYCLAFPGGLGVAVGAIAGAVAIKDRNVAAAKVITETGAVPAPPPDGPPVPVPTVQEPTP